jgi:hypothetical protein
VWEELIGTIGMTALIRNLARMTRLGTLGPFTTEATSRVVARLTNRDALAKARIHPMDVYLALKVYQSDSSQPGRRTPRQTWHPVQAISDALEVAYDMSFAGGPTSANSPPGTRLAAVRLMWAVTGIRQRPQLLPSLFAMRMISSKASTFPMASFTGL